MVAARLSNERVRYNFEGAYLEDDVDGMFDWGVEAFNRIDTALSLFNKPGATIDNVKAILEGDYDEN